MNTNEPGSSDKNRQQLVNAGAIPVLVTPLNSPDADVQCYCTTALSNIAVDGANRKKLAQSEPKLVTSLVALTESTGLKVQCQATLALRNLANDGALRKNTDSKSFGPMAFPHFYDFSSPLTFPSSCPPLYALGTCRYICRMNRPSSNLDSSNLLSFKDNEELQCHAISTLRNLAASSEKNKTAIGVD
ncbi:Vacuolar protein 8 [Marasmius sp. AFHP31]|nr:Vacuolar protein 8 [Marasmius sp. AFHP31]